MSDDITIRDYLDIRIKAVEDQITALRDFQEQHFKLAERAITKAEESMNLRVHNLNEWRQQGIIKDALYATKEQLEVYGKTCRDRIGVLEQHNAFAAGKVWMVMAALTVIPTVIAILSLVYK